MHASNDLGTAIQKPDCLIDERKLDGKIRAEPIRLMQAVFKLATLNPQGSNGSVSCFAERRKG